MSKFLNTCLECKNIDKKALWKVIFRNGPAFKEKYFLVGPELGLNPEHFDLDSIDAKLLASEWNLKEDEVEDLIMSGEPVCPKCKSVLYVEYNEKLDK